MTPAMYRRLLLLGIVTTQDFQALFDICDDTVTRAYKRGDIPPPVTACLGVMHGPSMPSSSTSRSRLEEARAQAEREQAQRDTKVAALYGGHPHGRRP